MSRISPADRQLQLAREAAGEHLYANRVRVYPKAVHGRVRRIKWAILIACLALYYTLPWLRWARGPGRPTQAVLLDLADDRFYFFNLELWPQDVWLLAGLLITAALSLFLVTSLVGRVWCGYTCPQTVWTDLFMWVERVVEGDRNERMQRDAQPPNLDSIRRKIMKHAAWLCIAFWTGGAWIMYYADAPSVTVRFWTGTASTQVYFFTFLFTLTTYVLAGWAREQVCTYMCPWPRFQSAMLDEQSFTVTYQSWRGEPRSRGKRPDTAAPVGDCVDCGACVTACPTGIDIRDGIQLECINCGLCMDACDHVMQVTHRPTGLITWDTLARQAAKRAGKHEPIKFLRARTIIYLAALCIAAVAMLTALTLRSTLNFSVQHDRAPLFVPLADGTIRNAYTINIANKTQQPLAFTLAVSGLPDAVVTSVEAGSATLAITADEVTTTRVLVTGHPAASVDGSQPIDFILRDASGETRATYHSIFMGPTRRQP